MRAGYLVPRERVVERIYTLRAVPTASDNRRYRFSQTRYAYLLKRHSCAVSLRCEPPFAARRDEGRFCFYGGDEKCPQVQLWTQV